MLEKKIEFKCALAFAQWTAYMIEHSTAVWSAEEDCDGNITVTLTGGF
jgi:hypothetical protein